MAYEKIVLKRVSRMKNLDSNFRTLWDQEQDKYLQNVLLNY